MTRQEKIKQALWQGKKMTIEQLVEEVGEHEKEVHEELKIMKRDGIVKVEKKLWSLK